MITFSNLMEICIKNKIKHFSHAPQMESLRHFPIRSRIIPNEASFDATTKNVMRLLNIIKNNDTKFTGLKDFLQFMDLI